MDEPIETSFEKLTGRKATAADRERLHRVKDALGLPDNDALWLWLIALDYHQTLYEEIPSRIEKLLEPVTPPRWWRWLIGGRPRSERVLRRINVALGTLAILGAAFVLGRQIGYTAGQEAWMGRHDLAAVSWANSPQGRRARVLADNGTLAWADSSQGRALRELTQRGLLDSLWSRVGEEPLDAALVRRADAEWMASEAGQRARTLSDDGTLAWLDSREAKMARELLARAPPDAFTAAADMAVVPWADAEWMASETGQRARTLSDDGTLAWLDSREAKMARELLARAPSDAFTAAADLAVVPWADAKWLESQAGRRARTLSDDGTLAWGQWLQAMVQNGLIAEVGKATARPTRCKGVTAMGFEWQETDGALDKYCRVWHYSIMVNMDRIGQSRAW